MKIKCEYCGNYLSDTEEKCPSCMAPNEHLRRVSFEVPQTIEQLKEWYQAHNLPSEEVTRFFIGKDIHEARAFGIYYDEKKGNYVVYKNKGSGERAVRYEGKDEAYAVNEIYLKLKEEIQNQKAMNQAKSTPLYTHYKDPTPYRHRSGCGSSIIKGLLLSLIPICLIPILILIIGSAVSYYPGYYESKNNLLYLYKNCSKTDNTNCEWYIYNEKADEWSLLANKNTVVKPKYGGRTWTVNNRLFKKYNVKTQYYEFDWYKQLHPPTPTKGYYNYNDQIYYYYYGWYVYDNGWYKADGLEGDIIYNPDYYYDYSSTSSDTYDFKDTSYYDSYSSDYDSDSSWSSSYDDDDWDSGSSWDSSDSWDSGGSDWDSDWRIKMLDLFKKIMSRRFL